MIIRQGADTDEFIQVRDVTDQPWIMIVTNLSGKSEESTSKRINDENNHAEQMTVIHNV